MDYSSLPYFYSLTPYSRKRSNVEAEPKASVIESDEQAIAVAQELAAQFVQEDSERDRQKRLPVEEVKKFSQSGLWGITVPREYGGAFVSNVTLARLYPL